MKYKVTLAVGSFGKTPTFHSYAQAYTWTGEASTEFEAISKAKSASGRHDWTPIEVKKI
jgi:hypothetical protein